MFDHSVHPCVEFITECSEGSNAWVLSDSQRIQQTLTNFVINAFQYTTSGYVKLSIEWEGVNVRFECEDTHSGIAKKRASKNY